MIRLAVLAACGAMILPAAALAQATPEAPPVAPAPQPAKVTPKKDRLVCKTQEEKGSRLGGKRVCRPQAEWDQMAHEQRMEFERKMFVAPSRQ